MSKWTVSGVLICEDDNEQKPIYYVSRSLIDAETRYPMMEKLALAVVTAAQKMRLYFQSHSVLVMTSQPLRTILHSPSQSGRLAKWEIELSEYDIKYKPRTSLKAQVLADFVIELVPKETDAESMTDKWKLHVDGASPKQGSGIGIQLESPTGEMIEQSFCLRFHASNNEAEYESLIAGLRLAISVSTRKISAFSDSQFVTSQFHGQYEAKNERMEAYLTVVQEIAHQFDHFELKKIPRGENTLADALAALASTSNPTVRRIIPVEGIKKPIINIPIKERDAQNNEPPHDNTIVTRSRAQKTTQDQEEEELEMSQVGGTHAEFDEEDVDNYEEFTDKGDNIQPVKTRPPTTSTPAPNDANHEVNTEAHEAF